MICLFQLFCRFAAEQAERDEIRHRHERVREVLELPYKLEVGDASDEYRRGVNYVVYFRALGAQQIFEPAPPVI